MDFNKIKNYLENKEYENATNILLDELKEKNNKDSDICLELAKIYEMSNDYDNSLKYLNIALEFSTDINRNQISFELAKVYNFKNNYKKSIEILNNLILQLENKDEFYLNSNILLSKNYELLYDYKNVSNVVDKLENDFSNNDKLKNIRLDLNKRLYERFPGNYGFDGDYYKLIQTYKDILNINPSNNQVLCFLAQTYNYLGLYDSTVELYMQNKDKVKDNLFFENKFLNEYEIASKQTILKSKPRNLMVVLSNKCNLNCIMCLTHKEKWELPQERLDEIINLFPYIERIYWQGGEVLFLPYFKKILNMSLQYPNIRQCIITNFQLADDEFINLIIKNNIEITVSIDGITKEMYEKIRVGGKFDRLLNNLEKLNNRRNEVWNNKTILNMNVVVMRENHNRLADFVDFAHKYGFNFICFMQLQYSPRNASKDDIKFKEDQDIFTYHTQEEQKIMSFQMRLVYKRAEKYGIRIESRIPVVDLTEKEILKYDVNNELIEKKELTEKLQNIDKNDCINCDEIKSEQKEEIKEEVKDIVFNKQVCENNSIKLLCHLPWHSLVLDFDGNVRPDCQCDIHSPVATLSNSSICSLWNNFKMKKYRENILNFNYKKNKCSNNCIEGKIIEYHLKLI